MMQRSKLSDLPNIGKELEKRLESVGISTREQLAEIGSLEALRRVVDQLDTGCINMLYALEGAIQGIRWHKLPAEVKQDLKDQLSQVT